MRTFLIALAIAAGAAPAAQAHTAPPPADPNQIDQPELGMVFRGLEYTAVGPCAGGYKLLNTDGCTHGPDPAPAGVDIRIRPPLATVYVPPAKVPCIGNGSTGKRVQVLYVRASDVPDRYAASKPDIGADAVDADRIVRESAAQTSGLRRIRFAHDAYCSVTIDNVVIGPADDDTFAATKTAVKALGYNRTDRKYLMFVDATVYCGIANRANDDAPTANANDGGPTFARVDAGCWGGRVAAHELVHTIGGVQNSAPHSSGGGHCTDEYDRMCYSDKPYFPAMQYLCASTEERHLDCNKDDYFSTAPAAGSYLDTHWNTANSAYLSNTPEDLSGFVHADDPAAASYTPTDALNQNSSYVKNTVARTARGVYEVTFPNFASYGGDSGNAQATAYGSAGEHCTTSAWSSNSTPDMTVTVRCFDAAGATADIKFDASYIRPTTSSAPFAYLWANEETNPAYTPSTYHQFNSTGATNTIVRNGTGDYRVALPGVAAAGGTAKVTAFSAAAVYCKASDWDASGVNVLCFDFTGAPVDAKFTLSYADDTSILANGAASGYVWANDAAAASYTPNSAYQYNSTGATNTVTRTGTGLYTVSLPGLGSPFTSTNRGTVHVTAQHTHSKRCEVVAWSSAIVPLGTPIPLSIDVACHTAAGTPSDSRFVAQFSR